MVLSGLKVGVFSGGYRNHLCKKVTWAKVKKTNIFSLCSLSVKKAENCCNDIIIAMNFLGLHIGDLHGVKINMH